MLLPMLTHLSVIKSYKLDRMKLYTLLGGKSKKKIVRLETNSKNKCENYMNALKSSNLKQYQWFEIREALPDEELKIHKSQNSWTGYKQ